MGVRAKLLGGGSEYNKSRGLLGRDVSSLDEEEKCVEKIKVFGRGSR